MYKSFMYEFLKKPDGSDFLFISPELKYNFKVLYDQVDTGEVVTLSLFEQIVNSLIELDKQHYNMMELGCNSAYYSMMFQCMLREQGKRCSNYMIEAVPENLARGVQHFRTNNLAGTFSKYVIGEENQIRERISSYFNTDNVEILTHGSEVRTVEQLFEEYEIEHLDVLHCDIDHSELSMLETSKKLFKNQKIKFLILSTHGLDMHNKCLDFLESCDYQILYNHDDVKNPIGFDLLIVAQAL